MITAILRIKRKSIMCTAIGYKGKDIIYGYNLDVDPAVWNYGIYKTENYFTIGIKVGSTLYFTHGVNNTGAFGNLPYMNGSNMPSPEGMKKERIDLLTDRYIRGKYSYDDVKRILSEKAVVNAEGLSMHSLLGSPEGDMAIVEPGYGIKKVSDRYAVLSNFPVLADLDDYSNPFYGKERYDRAVSILESADDLGVRSALDLLYTLRQDGQWGTRVSFVYSKNENAVYYFLDGDVKNIQIHEFQNRR